VKQLLFMTILLLMGALGAIVHPFYGVLLYYTFAVLRPQYLWKWALPIDVRWSLLAALAAMAGVALALPRVIANARWNTVATLMIVFAALLMFSCLTAVDADIAKRWGIEYAKVFLMAAIATLVIHRMAHVRYLAIMIFVTIGYIAWEINSLYIFDGRLDIFHYGFGGLDNNGAALMIAMGLPFAYAFWQIWKTRWLQLACGLAAAFMTHAVLMSYSRGGMLSGIVGVVWLLLHHRPRWQVAPLLGVAILGLAVMAGPEIQDRFLSVQGYEEDHSAQARFDSWSAAWAMAWDHPFTGVGVRNSNLFSEHYGADRFGRTIHSQYLQIAADSGIPAAAVYILLAVIALRRLGRLRRDYGGEDPVDPEIAHIALAVQTSLIIFLFGGIFLSLEVVELPWLLLVMAGVMPAIARQHAPLTDVEESDEREDEATEDEAGQAAPAGVPRDLLPWPGGISP